MPTSTNATCAERMTTAFEAVAVKASGLCRPFACLMDHRTRKKVASFELKTVSLHNCGEGRTGVSDFVGVQHTKSSE